MSYEHLKKFAENKGIKATKFAEKETFKASKKGKVLSAAERNTLVETMAKDLGYLE